MEKSKKELWELVLIGLGENKRKRLDTTNFELKMKGGLCGIINYLRFAELITEQEKVILFEELQKNKHLASRRSEYWRGYGYWWIPMYDNINATEPRIAFVKKLIAIN